MGLRDQVLEEPKENDATVKISRSAPVDRHRSLHMNHRANRFTRARTIHAVTIIRCQLSDWAKFCKGTSPGATVEYRSPMCSLFVSVMYDSLIKLIHFLITSPTFRGWRAAGTGGHFMAMGRTAPFVECTLFSMFLNSWSLQSFFFKEEMMDCKCNGKGKNNKK